MIKIGQYNILSALRQTVNGFYLTDESADEVLLPNIYIPQDLVKGDEIEVFVYKDSEDRPVATTLKPKILLNEFALLKVLKMEKIGAFMDWGLPKDLLVPYSEQKAKMIEGHSYVVYMYLDPQTERLVGSAKLNKFLQQDQIDVKEGETVDLLVAEQTDLGFKVIINRKYFGLLFKNEVFEDLSIGSERIGFIKKIREDHKIDVSLQKPGYQNIEPAAGKIMKRLIEKNGFLGLTDKSNPEEITFELQMSKKSFKKAVGLLYKQHLVKLSEDGINLIK